MSSLDQVARRIEVRFREMRGPFPGSEIKGLVANRGIQVDLHIDLDLYLSGVAGYSSGARRLHFGRWRMRKSFSPLHSSITIPSMENVGWLLP